MNVYSALRDEAMERFALWVRTALCAMERFALWVRTALCAWRYDDEHQLLKHHCINCVYKLCYATEQFRRQRTSSSDHTPSKTYRVAQGLSGSIWDRTSEPSTWLPAGRLAEHITRQITQKNVKKCSSTNNILKFQNMFEKENDNLKNINLMFRVVHTTTCVLKRKAYLGNNHTNEH